MNQIQLTHLIPCLAFAVTMTVIGVTMEQLNRDLEAKRIKKKRKQEYFNQRIKRI